MSPGTTMANLPGEGNYPVQPDGMGLRAVDPQSGIHDSVGQRLRELAPVVDEEELARFVSPPDTGDPNVHDIDENARQPTRCLLLRIVRPTNEPSWGRSCQNTINADVLYKNALVEERSEVGLHQPPQRPLEDVRLCGDFKRLTVVGLEESDLTHDIGVPQEP